jgi:hypothetical protein
VSTNQCVECSKQRRAKWKARHPEQARVSNLKRLRAAYDRDPQRILERNRAWRKKHPDRVRAFRLKREYGLRSGEYDAMKERQRGRCAICEEPAERLTIDHCHQTGIVRSLLCGTCNSGLGYFKDNPDFLLAAIWYLKVHEAKQAETATA